jgi:formylglycine-generating enzyme required for sulfatase activity
MNRASQSQKRREPTLIAGLAVMLAAVGLLIWLPGKRSLAQQDRNRQLVQTGSANDGHGKRVALVIGNGEYTNAPRLKNPPNDARDMAAALKDVGFEILNADNLTNLTQRQMKQLIREFGQKLRGGGVGLFFYAGHGVQAKGHNYLIPVEAEIESEAELSDTTVDLDLILNYMEDAGNGLNIVILDACRNNPFARSFRNASNGLAAVEAPTGTLIAYATGPNRVASDGTGRNGLYTGEMLRMLREPGVEIVTLLRRVGGRVSQATSRKQEPWVSSNVYNDFYFVLSKSETANAVEKPNPVRIPTVDAEAELWDSIKNSSDPEDFRVYLKEYERGPHVVIARNNLRRLEAAKPAGTGNGAAKTNNPARPATAAKQFANRAGIEMVWITPGSFQMGSENGGSDEKPVHQVTIGSGFYMGKTELTQAQWKAVMGTDPSHFKGDDLPVEQVSWIDAQEFIRKLNEMESASGLVYRLPTEAEWEYACRAGTTGDYAGDLDSMAWYDKNSNNQTHPIGKKAPNGFGLYDMHGNVFQWCEDAYHESYNGAPTDGSAWLSGGDSTRRVVRGGSWYADAVFCRSAIRHWGRTDYRLNYFGFRVVAAGRT